MRKRICEVRDMYCRTISPIEAALCRTDAMRLVKSCTPPMNIEPRGIPRGAGGPPNHIPAVEEVPSGEDDDRDKDDDHDHGGAGSVERTAAPRCPRRGNGALLS